MDSEQSVADLVHAAVQGDEEAWDALVERYSPLLMSVLRRYRMGNDDVRDVAQTVWLRLIENLGNLREPRALPSWIITTARNESLRVLKAGAYGYLKKPFDEKVLVLCLENALKTRGTA